MDLKLKEFNPPDTLKVKVNFTETLLFLVIFTHIPSGSDITLCNKIDKPLVVYRFSSVM